MKYGGSDQQDNKQGALYTVLINRYNVVPIYKKLLKTEKREVQFRPATQLLFVFLGFLAHGYSFRRWKEIELEAALQFTQSHPASEYSSNPSHPINGTIIIFEK